MSDSEKTTTAIDSNDWDGEEEEFQQASDRSQTDVELINSLILAAQDGDLANFKELARDADDFHLNWALCNCTSADIAKYIAIDRATTDTLGSCYIQAVCEKNDPIVEFVEALPNEDVLKTCVIDAIEEIMVALKEVEVVNALERVFKLSSARLGTPCIDDSDLKVIELFREGRERLAALVKTKLPEAHAIYEERAAESSDDGDDEDADSNADDL